MVKIGDYKISDIYQGGYSSLDPSYGNLFTGYRASISNLGVGTDPRSANILKEVSDKIAPGQKTVELALITPEVIETVPGPHLTEVRRLSKLTGVDVTVHGPLVEASGLSREGFSEGNRKAVERQMLSAVKKAHEINPKEGVPITFHSSAMLPGPEITRTKEGEETERLPIIDQETDQVHMVRKEHKFYPGMVDEETGEKIPLEKGKKYTAEEQVNTMNQTQWSDSLANVEFQRENAERIIRDTHPIFRELYVRYSIGELDPNSLSSKEHEELRKIFSAHEYLKQAEMNINSLFNKAYKYGTDVEKRELKTVSESYVKSLGMWGLFPRVVLGLSLENL